MRGNRRLLHWLGRGFESLEVDDWSPVSGAAVVGRATCLASWQLDVAAVCFPFWTGCATSPRIVVRLANIFACIVGAGSFEL